MSWPSLLRARHNNAPVLYEGTSYGQTRVLNWVKERVGGSADACVCVAMFVSESQCDS